MLCVVSGPSGTGKTTLCRALSEVDARVVYSVSCTTRAPRAGEVDGVDYEFLGREAFEAQVEVGAFLEYAEVHGNYYGTRRGWVLERMGAGYDVVMDLDVQGAAQVRAAADGDVALAGRCFDVFLRPRNLDELGRRLSGRRTEGEAELALRLANAREEMARADEYRYRIVSGTREEDLAAVVAIFERERERLAGGG